MTEEQDPDAELLRRFEAVIADAGLDDLRQLAKDLLSFGGTAREARRPRMPDLRRPPLADLKTFRIRVDLKHSRPPIWRRLEVRSDLRLDAMHQVLQAAFGWDDYHLWRFSLGGGPFDHGNQLFLCPYDVHEGELEDEGGVPAGEVRLDETMQESGDVLAYVYDYGDNWELALRLEQILPVDPGAPWAACVDGRRAAPPEDCGSLRDAEDLAEVLQDPAHFDLEEINEALQAPYFALREAGVNAALVDLVNRLAYSSVGEDLTARALQLIGEPTQVDDQEVRDCLQAFTWFLDRAADGGIQLTAAGYLRPSDVEAAAEVVPMMADWIGKANREIDTTPVMRFRELLQELGLLRKYKGALRLTRVGASARVSNDALLSILAGKLVAADSDFDRLASLLVLTYAATSPDAEIPLDTVATALDNLGWQTGSGEPIVAHHLHWLPALEVLVNVKRAPSSWRERRVISPAAARLAHAALRVTQPERRS